MAKRVLERDLADAKQVMDEIHDNTEDLLSRAKRPRNFQDADEIPDVFAAVQTLFIDLRSHNRAVRNRARQQLARQKKIQDALQELEDDIQNLKYERNHYKREIQSSRTLPSEVAKVDLIPEDQFRLLAPPELQLKGDEADPQHTLLLNRLQFELHQRKELQRMEKELREREREIMADTESKLSFLGSIRSQLSNFADLVKSMKMIMGVTINEDLEARELALALPRPLYHFFRQFIAFKEVRKIEYANVEIVGDLTEAKRFNANNPSVDRYDPHPLHLRLQVNLKDVLDLQFEIFYLPALALVTIRAKNTIGEDVLTALYEGDYGDYSPNPALIYLFGSDFVIDKNQRGRPFRWLQSLCGVNFLPPDTVYSSLTALERAAVAQRSLEASRDLDDATSSSLSSTKISLSPSQLYTMDVHAIPDLDSFLSRIHTRARAVKALHEQLESLGKNKIPVELKTRLPIRSMCTFTNWTTIDAATFYNRKATSSAEDAEKKSKRRKERAKEPPRIDQLKELVKVSTRSKLLEMALPDVPDDGKEEGEIMEERERDGEKEAEPREEGEVRVDDAKGKDKEKEDGEVDAMDIDNLPTPSSVLVKSPDLPPKDVTISAPDKDKQKDKEEGEIAEENVGNEGEDTVMVDAEPDDGDEDAADELQESGQLRKGEIDFAETFHTLTQEEVDHDRYYSCTFKLGDKLIDELKVLIRIPVQYPQARAEFRFGPRVYSASPLAHLDTATRKLCDPKATMLASQTYHSKTLDVNFEVNEKVDTFVKTPEDQLHSLSLQLRKIKMCLDMLLEINKKGRESNIVKILGRAFTGRERMLCFDQAYW